MQSIQQVIREIITKCQGELQQLQVKKDEEIEELIEKQTEEKFLAQMEIKKNYQQQINFIQKSKDLKKEEKMMNMENKKFEELTEVNLELTQKKKEGLFNIKEKYNSLSSKVSIDSDVLKNAIKEHRLQYDKPSVGAVESPIRDDKKGYKKVKTLNLDIEDVDDQGVFGDLEYKNISNLSARQ